MGAAVAGVIGDRSRQAAVSGASWCRACGGLAGTEGAACARCGVPLADPDPGLPRIGLVAVVRWRRARHLGVVAHESVQSVHLLVEGKHATEMPLAAFDAAVVDVPGPAVASAAGRLWKALAAQLAGTLAVSGLTARWHPEVAASIAYRLATASLGARRAAARDALALGTAQVVIDGLDLPALEACWYQAWAAAAAGDTSGLLGWLERLPPAGYPARAGLLLARATDLIRDRALGARAAAQLAPFTADGSGVRALHAVLATEPTGLTGTGLTDAGLTDTGLTDTVAVLGDYLETAGGAAELADRLAGELYDLRATMDMVFASQWAAALAAGNDLAGRAGLPAIRAEALNIAAFCHDRLGDRVAALRALETALDGGPAVSPAETGLLVNASITAAAAGSAVALPYLARIASSGPNPSVRAAACGRAIDLWMADPAAQEYPGTLRAMVRGALASRQDDEFHWRLLRLASRTDAAWLAVEAHVRSADQGQADAERYWRTWAQATAGGGQQDLSDVAAVLGEVAGQPAPPAWARTELRGFAQQLDESVHVEFGTAVHLVPAIEALLDAGVLDLDQRLVLAAQAGAHIAAEAADHDGVIAPEHERRLLVEVAAEYRRRQGQLTETAREYVRGELARCLSVAARGVAVAALSDWETGTEQWNELVGPPPPDSPDPGAVRAAKLRILAALQLWVTRLRDYRTALDDLPGTEAADDLASTLSGLVDGWSAELTRLRPFV